MPTIENTLDLEFIYEPIIIVLEVAEADNMDDFINIIEYNTIVNPDIDESGYYTITNTNIGELFIIHYIDGFMPSREEILLGTRFMFHGENVTDLVWYHGFKTFCDFMEYFILW